EPGSRAPDHRRDPSPGRRTDSCSRCRPSRSVVRPFRFPIVSFCRRLGYDASLPPRRHPMELGRQIETTNTAYFRHDYDCEHADIRRLYEQAKIDQWNAATDIDWSRPLEGDGGLIVDDLVDITAPSFGSPSPHPRGRVNPLFT